MNSPGASQTIVFFDGVCHLCNAFVDFAVERDTERRLQFAPLQGTTAKRLLPAERLKDLNTVLVWRDGKILSHSEAVLQVFGDLGGAYKFLGGAGRIVPRPLRDGVYNFVARHRYGWFGKAETCRLPTKDEKAQVLE